MITPVVCATASVPCGKYPDRLSTELEVEVIASACASAGIRSTELDGLLLVPPGYRLDFGQIRAQRVAERLGCAPGTAVEVDIGGLSALYAFRIACLEVASGRCDVACVAGAQAERTQPVTAQDAERFRLVNAMFGPWIGMHGVGTVVPCYALSAQRYMHEHGVGAAEIAEVVVRLQRHAAANPKAELRTEITVEDVLGSRIVSPPIHLYEAARWSDGACAVLVSSGEWARGHGLETTVVTGWGERHSPTNFVIFDGDLTRFPWIGEATREALDAAGRSLDDVDVAEIYGAFAASELMTYEAMGFFAPGEAAKAMREGRTTYGGDVVINPSGGRLCLGHPPPATPLYEIEEIHLQLTGRAGDRQVPGATVGVVQAEHGMMNGAGVAVLEAT